MKLAYLDCIGGISGDMMLGALVDAGVDLPRLNVVVESLGLPGCRLIAEEVTSGGFRATQVVVQHEPEHSHRHLPEILKILGRGRLSDAQADLARRIFTRLAEAEAKVHGIGVEKVHFHEVGAADSIADIVGTAVGWDLLGVDRVVASPVPTGSGMIRIAHGECSVPAPATAELLRGIPLAACDVGGEMTTPTGAAILATLVESFGPLPPMEIEAIGYGAGQRTWAERPNVLRLFVGRVSGPTDQQQVWVLETNLDDVSGEMVGYCTTRLWEAGALDVFATAIQMKKNRPGVKLSVLAQSADVPAMEEILFEETTTLGVRRWPASRHVLARHPHCVQTEWGPIEGKVGWLAAGTPRFVPEFESCRQVASRQEIPLRTVYEVAQKAFDPKQVERP